MMSKTNSMSNDFKERVLSALKRRKKAVTVGQLRRSLKSISGPSPFELATALDELISQGCVCRLPRGLRQKVDRFQFVQVAAAADSSTAADLESQPSTRERRANIFIASFEGSRCQYRERVGKELRVEVVIESRPTNARPTNAESESNARAEGPEVAQCVMDSSEPVLTESPVSETHEGLLPATVHPFLVAIGICLFLTVAILSAFGVVTVVGNAPPWLTLFSLCFFLAVKYFRARRCEQIIVAVFVLTFSVGTGVTVGGFAGKTFDSIQVALSRLNGALSKAQ